MEALSIIETLNKKFEAMNCKEGVHFILHKKVTPSSFKAYKEYDYTLWYISNGKKYQATRIYHTARAVTEKEESDNIKYVEEQLLTNIFSFLLDNNNLKLMLDGTFTGYGI